MRSQRGIDDMEMKWEINKLVIGMAIMAFGGGALMATSGYALSQGCGGEGNREWCPIPMNMMFLFAFVPYAFIGIGMGMMTLYCEDELKRERAEKHGRAADEAIQDIPIAKVD
jgi:hypothetical protein